MPRENYSHMMMESEYMVVGEDVGGDDGGEDLEILPSSVENMTNLTPERKIVDVTALCFVKTFVLLAI
jgi:hypothetical protein